MPKKAKLSPKRNSSEIYDIVKIIVIITIVIYIVGVIPTFTNTISVIFSNPLFKIGFLIFILYIGYKDLTIGSLLLIAFIISYLSITNNIGGVGSGTQKLVGGVSSGTQQLVGGVSSGAKTVLTETGKIIGNIGSGTQQVLGGVGDYVGGIGGNIGSGTQQVLGGIGQLIADVGSGTQQVLGGAGNAVGGIGNVSNTLLNKFGTGTQQLVGGIGGGVQQLVGGIGTGTQQLVGGIGTGTQQLVGGIGGVGNSYENMENSPGMSVSQAYEQHMYNENNGDKGCNVQPKIMTGCEPIIGYNSPYNCGCSGACGGKCKGLDPACLCTGVSVWEDEMNAQGLNFPIGYSGSQIGSII